MLIMTFVFHLALIVAFIFIPSIHSQGYAAYSGFGADQSENDPKSVALASNIRKAPVAPIAPPRVPLFPSDEPIINAGNNNNGQSTSNSVSYRPAPPPVRRDARSEGKCRFDGAKWQMHPQSAAANAVMFDRTSGLSCEQCMDLCTKFQDHSTEWICRSLTYDHQWKICDLFAVNGTELPYFLLDYEGRDYFEYMAALPPTDLEMLGINRKEERDSANYDKNSIVPVTLAPSLNSVQSKTEKGLDGNNKQCNCPCKALAQLTAQEIPPLKLGENVNEKEKENISQQFDDFPSNASSISANELNIGQNEEILFPSAENSPKHLAGVKPIPSFSGKGNIVESSPSPLPIIGGQPSSVSIEMSINSESTQEPNRVFPSLSPLPPFDSSSQPTTINSFGEEQQNENNKKQQQNSSMTTSDLDLLFFNSSSSSSSSTLFDAQFDSSSFPRQSISSELTSFSIQSSSSSSIPPISSNFASSDSSIQLSSANSSSSQSISSETIIITNTSSSSYSSSSSSSSSPSSLSSVDSTSSSSFSSSSADVSSSKPSTNIRKAFSSKTFQPYNEVRVPFRKTLDKVAHVGMKLFTDNGNSGEKRMPFSAEITQQKSIRACPKEGQIAHYVQIRGRIAKRKGRIELAKGTKYQRECLNACDSPTGHLSVCNSAQLSPKGCELSQSTVNLSLADSLVVVPKNYSSEYLEKICLDSNIAKSEKRRIFQAIPGFILVGHVQEVSNAGSLAECLKSCLLAEIDFGFVCKSLMYYPADQDQNCLMNSESRHTQRDVFVPEDQLVVNMLYLDIDQPQKVPSALPTDEQRRFRDSPMDAKMEEGWERANAKWTRWSKCLNSSENTNNEMRHRYLKCKEAKDIRKCPKESIPCERMPSLKIQRIWRTEIEKTTKNEFSDCLAVKDARGIKRCPYGMRWNGSKREFCTPPVDC